MIQTSQGLVSNRVWADTDNWRPKTPPSTTGESRSSEKPGEGRERILASTDVALDPSGSLCQCVEWKSSFSYHTQWPIFSIGSSWCPNLAFCWLVFPGEGKTHATEYSVNPTKVEATSTSWQRIREWKGSCSTGWNVDPNDREEVGWPVWRRLAGERMARKPLRTSMARQ